MVTKQRKTRRIECDALVDFSTPREAILDHHVQNLSLGGACLRAAKVEPVGTPVLLVLNFPDLGGETLELQGEVAWANDTAPCDMGIRFVGLSPEAREVLQRYVARRAEAP